MSCLTRGISLDALPEVFVSTTSMTQAVWRPQPEGTVRNISPRVYTKSLTDTPKQIVRPNLWGIGRASCQAE